MPDPTEIQVTGAEVAGLFDPTTDDTLSSEERVILSALLTRDDRVDLAVPDGMDPRALWQTLDLCSRVFLRVRHASGQLKLLIGRALLVIQDTPEVFITRGFNTFDQFMSDLERGLPHITGISRGELYKAKSVAGSVGPSMNMEDARSLGFAKMQLVAGNTAPGSAQQKALIEAAKTQTIPELREHIARAGFAEAGDLESDVLQVHVTKTQKRVVQSFLGNPQVQAYCETSSAGLILERMVAEVEAEWEIHATVIEGIAE